MDNHFFERPILNSPYDPPERHWELDSQGQPTQHILESRRKAEFITPIPKPKKQKQKQDSLIFDEGKGLSTEKQLYDPTPIINDLRYQVDQWLSILSHYDSQLPPEIKPRPTELVAWSWSTGLCAGHFLRHVQYQLAISFFTLCHPNQG